MSHATYVQGLNIDIYRAIYTLFFKNIKDIDGNFSKTLKNILEIESSHINFDIVLKKTTFNTIFLNICQFINKERKKKKERKIF